MTTHSLEYIEYLSQMNPLFGEDALRCTKICTEQIRKWNRTRNNEDFNELLFYIRSLIRAFFAHVEGITYVMRQIALKAYERGEVKYSLGQVVLLKEETYELKRNKITSRDKWNDFWTNFNLTFMLFPRVFNSDFKLDKSDDGFKHFKEAYKARHSITHPKSRKEFMVPYEVFKDIDQALEWFAKNMRELIKTLR